MNKNVLIIAHYTGAFERGNENNRINEIFHRLNNLDGVQCEIITSSFSHKWKKQKKKPTEPNITFIHEPSYKRNISLGRIIAHIKFSINVYKYLKEYQTVPDVVYTTFPTPFALFAVVLFFKKKNIPIVVDIQDIWPEAFVLSLPKKLRWAKKVIFAPFDLLNRVSFKRVTRVISVSDTYLKQYRNYFNNMQKNSGQVVFLGTSLSQFKRNFSLPVLVTTNAFDTYDLNLCYLGKLSHSYDLQTAIEAVEALPFLKIGLHILGTGPLEEKFKDRSRKQENIHFHGNIPYASLPSYLSKCDVGLNVIVPDAAQSITNKHADYAAAGLAVLNTQENEEYQYLLQKYRFGINIKCGCAKSLSTGILELYNNRAVLNEMQHQSRKFAEEYMDRDITYPKLISEILNVEK